MKNVLIFSVFFSAIFAVAAQTNFPTVLETNAAPREMSLQDCIQQALAHNLDVQIQRYNPQISLYDLNGAYGGWDPTFTASGVHSHNVSGGGLGPSLTNTVPPSRTEVNSFRSGLSGGTPWGMTYNLSGNINDTYGTSGGAPFERSGGSIGISGTQPLLKNFWIDGTRLSIRTAKLSLKQSEQGFRSTIMDTVTAVAGAYYEL
ncbi:MAG TPA: TolC family protein, partial [Candidatus Baltobacteraceae bacterium]|nr:TolC family protein [Candidatus Baltobacteraceae bacterium]